MDKQNKHGQMIGVFIKFNLSNIFSQGRIPPNQREVNDGKNHNKIQAVEMKNINKFGNVYCCTDQRI